MILHRKSRKLLFGILVFIISFTNIQNKIAYASDIMGPAGGFAQIVMEYLRQLGLVYDWKDNKNLDTIIDLDEFFLSGKGLLITDDIYAYEDWKINYAEHWIKNDTDEANVIWWRMTEINGKYYFINPNFLNQLKSNGSYDSFITCCNNFASMGINQLTDVNLVNEQQNTALQQLVSNAVNFNMQQLASIVESLSDPGYQDSDMTEEDLIAINNNLMLQSFRQYLDPEIIQYNYYLILTTTDYIFAYLSNDLITFTQTSSKSDKFINVSSGSKMLNYQYSKSTLTETIFNTSYLLDSWNNLLFSNCPNIEFMYSQTPKVYSGINYPYIPNQTVGALSTLVNNALIFPRDNMNLSENDTKELYGIPDPTLSYENNNTSIPDMSNVDTEKEYNTSVLSWLSQIYSQFTDITQNIADGSETIVDGFAISFAQALGGYTTYEDEDGNILPFPALLNNIYEKIAGGNDTTKDIEKALDDVNEKIETLTDAKAMDKAITTALPTGGGGLFQLIIALILILLLLLYFFLRCLQFIVLLFQVPASSEMLPSGMIQGLEWLKTTKLIGNSEPQLSMSGLTAGNTIGFDITIWGFMIGVIDLLILFYIIKQLRRYIERWDTK